MTLKRNEPIGICTCVICGQEAQVSRERQSGLLYYNCPDCKCVRMKGATFQNQIMETFQPLHAAPDPGPELEPVPAIEPETAPEPEPEPVPESVPESVPEPEPAAEKRSGWFGDV